MSMELKSTDLGSTSLLIVEENVEDPIMQGHDAEQ
jgi:hypothetical protein